MGKLYCSAIGFPIFLWWVAIILCLPGVDLDDYIILADNRCYYSTEQFIQAKYYIPDIIDYQVNMTLVSNQSHIKEFHHIENYKLWTTISGLGLPVLGFASLLAYPNNSSCVNATSYFGKSITLFVFWIILLLYVIYLGIKHLKHIKKKRNKKINSRRELLDHTTIEMKEGRDYM